MKRVSIALALLLGGCRCAPRYQPPPLSPQAAAIFSRADLPGAGGSLVLDFEQARELGLLKPGGQGFKTFSDLMLYVLPGVATELSDQPAGRLAARSVVLIGLLRDWGTWPHLQRFGLLVPAPLPGESLDGIVGGTTVVLAVRGSQAANAQLLQGIAALDRASGRPLLRSAGGDLCYAGEFPGGQACVRAGDGYFAVSSPEGLRALLPGKGSPRPPAPPPALVRLRAEVPLMGKAELSLSGTTSVKLAATVTTEDEKLAQTLEKTANEYLARLDQSRARMRTIIAPELKSTKAALARDPEAPAGLKSVTAGMTLDQLLDPAGTYRALRQSIHVARQKERVAVEVTFPEPMVRQLTQGSGALVSVAVAGVLAAVAVPNFLKFQCRAKQAEAKANLRALSGAQQAFEAAHGHPAATFEELGWRPLEPAAYTYCLQGGCLACTKAGCPPVDPHDNPCATKLGSMPPDDASHLLCALGDPAGANDPHAYDVWFTFVGEPPINIQNGCD